MTRWLRHLSLSGWLAAVCLAIAGCVSPGPADSEHPAGTATAVWPPPPEAARLALLQTISTAADLGIRKSLWNRLLGWVTGEEDIALLRPASVVVKPDETLFVADPGIMAVHRFDRRAGRHDVLLPQGGGPFYSPVALALANDGRVFVADSVLRRIFVIDPGADSAVPMATGEELGRPTGMTVDRGRERLYVVDTARHRVLALSLGGDLLFAFGGRGTGDGQFNYPTFVWHDGSSDRLWVTDSLNFRIQAFDAEGLFVAAFGEPGNVSGRFARPKGVATDGEGHVYVVDALHHGMQIFDPSGRLLLFVGEQGSDAGQFWLPSGVFIDPEDRVFVADSFNKRVQVFQYLAHAR
jgi:DNA-binding beta-propeller fold protein YncE